MGLKKWLTLDFSTDAKQPPPAEDAAPSPTDGPPAGADPRELKAGGVSGPGRRRHTSFLPASDDADGVMMALAPQQVEHRRRTAWDAADERARRLSSASTATDMFVDARMYSTGMSELETHSDGEEKGSRATDVVPSELPSFAATFPGRDRLDSRRASSIEPGEPGGEADGSVPSLRRRNSLMNSLRFSWLNVLGQSTRSDVAGVDSPGQEQEVAQEVEQGQEEVASEHSADVSVEPQDNEMGVIMQGWLEKCGQQFKTWNWRFFVLRNDGVLSYYADEHKKRLKGSMDIGYGAKADISVQTNLMDKKFVFMIATPQRNLMISAQSQRTMTKWIAKLHAAGANPTEPWDPLRKTVKFYVHDTECPHEWKRYDDPTSYIHMEGCLMKRGHFNKNWKNRFFRIEKGKLLYYTENQEDLRGSVALKDTIVSPGMAQCSDGRRFYFVLTSKDGKFEMHLNAHNESSMHLWIEALQEAQTALGRTAAKGTVAGLALVVKRAEEIPLVKVQLQFHRPEEIDLQMDKRTEALIVTQSPSGHVAVGSQLISVDRKSILRETYAEARATLRASAFPVSLEFLLPPYKKGVLVKKSRSGFENWKKRMVIVTNGEIHYYKMVSGGNSGGSGSSSRAGPALKHRKSFSLYGCYLNLIQVPGRDTCIVVARSPSDKLVLQTTSEEERSEWASVMYCSIRMVSQGITSGHIEHLQLEQPRRVADPQPGDLAGGFRSDRALGF